MIETIRTPPVQAPLKRLDKLLRRAYYSVGVVGLVGLNAMRFLPIDAADRGYVSLALLSTLCLSAFGLLLYWHAGDSKPDVG